LDTEEEMSVTEVMAMILGLLGVKNLSELEEYTLRLIGASVVIVAADSGWLQDVCNELADDIFYLLRKYVCDLQKGW